MIYRGGATVVKPLLIQHKNEKENITGTITVVLGYLDYIPKKPNVKIKLTVFRYLAIPDRFTDLRNIIGMFEFYVDYIFWGLNSPILKYPIPVTSVRGTTNLKIFNNRQ